MSTINLTCFLFTVVQSWQWRCTDFSWSVGIRFSSAALMPWCCMLNFAASSTIEPGLATWDCQARMAVVPTMLVAGKHQAHQPWIKLLVHTSATSVELSESWMLPRRGRFMICSVSHFSWLQALSVWLTDIDWRRRMERKSHTWALNVLEVVLIWKLRYGYLHTSPELKTVKSLIRKPNEKADHTKTLLLFSIYKRSSDFDAITFQLRSNRGWYECCPTSAKLTIKNPSKCNLVLQAC